MRLSLGRLLIKLDRFAVLAAGFHRTAENVFDCRHPALSVIAIAHSSQPISGGARIAIVKMALRQEHTRITADQSHLLLNIPQSALKLCGALPLFLQDAKSGKQAPIEAQIIDPFVAVNQVIKRFDGIELIAVQIGVKSPQHKQVPGTAVGSKAIDVGFVSVIPQNFGHDLIVECALCDRVPQSVPELMSLELDVPNLRSDASQPAEFLQQGGRVIGNWNLIITNQATLQDEHPPRDGLRRDHDQSVDRFEVS